MTREDKAAARVRKLLELARNNPSIEEAANAFARAQEIAARHALDLDDLATAPPDAPPRRRDVESVCEREIESFNRAAMWKVLLAEAVAGANRCNVYYTAGKGGGITCYGQPSDIDTVGYMYAAIRVEVDRIANAASRGKGRSWGRNFRLGAVHEIDKRLKAATIRVVRELQQEAFKVGGETALARVSTALEHDVRVRRAVEEFRGYLGLRRSTHTVGSYGYGDGRKAGRGVGLGNSDGATRSLGEGGE